MNPGTVSTSSISDSLLNRIKKLLAKTQEAGCTTSEAESAFAKASALMAEHNLSMAQIESSEEDDWKHSCDIAPIMDLRRLTFKYQIAGSLVQQFFFVKLFRHKNRLVIFGHKDNIELALYAFSTLVESIDDLWAKYRLKTMAPLNWKKSFQMGIYEGFKNHMEMAQKKTEKEIREPGTEITLASVKDKIDKQYDIFIESLVELGVIYRDNKEKEVKVEVNPIAYGEGYQRGKELSINRRIESNKQSFEF